MKRKNANRKEHTTLSEYAQVFMMFSYDEKGKPSYLALKFHKHALLKAKAIDKSEICSDSKSNSV